MAKSKQEKQQTKAEAIAQIQRVGYLPFDEYELFCDIAKRAKVRVESRKMGDVTMVIVADTKFYTETK